MHIGSIFQRAIFQLKSPELFLHPGKEEALQEVEQGVKHIEGYVKAVMTIFLQTAEWTLLDSDMSPIGNLLDQLSCVRLDNTQSLSAFRAAQFEYSIYPKLSVLSCPCELPLYFLF